MAFSWYNARLKTHPYVTNAITSCFLSSLGDYLSQTSFRRLTHTDHPVPRLADFKEQQKPHGHPHSGSPPAPFSHHYLVYERPDTGLVDLRRTLIFSSFTLLFGSPMMVTFFRIIDRAIPYRTIPMALVKGSLTYSTAFFFNSFNSVYVQSLDSVFIKNHTPNETWEHLTHHLQRLSGDIVKIQKYAFCFWFPHWIPQFYLLPPHVRLVYNSTLGIVWSAILSYLVHHDEKKAIAVHSDSYGGDGGGAATDDDDDW